MSTLHVAWVRMAENDGSDGTAKNFIRNVVSSENLTVSGISAQTGARPADARSAIIYAVDADMYVTNGATAAATTGKYLKTGTYGYFTIASGGKIAAIEV